MTDWTRMAKIALGPIPGRRTLQKENTRPVSRAAPYPGVHATPALQTLVSRQVCDALRPRPLNLCHVHTAVSQSCRFEQLRSNMKGKKISNNKHIR